MIILRDIAPESCLNLLKTDWCSLNRGLPPVIRTCVSGGRHDEAFPVRRLANARRIPSQFGNRRRHFLRGAPVHSRPHNSKYLTEKAIPTLARELLCLSGRAGTPDPCMTHFFHPDLLPEEIQ